MLWATFANEDAFFASSRRASDPQIPTRLAVSLEVSASACCAGSEFAALLGQVGNGVPGDIKRTASSAKERQTERQTQKAHCCGAYL